MWSDSMHQRVLATVSIVSLLLIGKESHAAYVGLSLTSQVATGGRIAHRVYALFTDPNDYLTTVSGSPTLGNLVIQTVGPSGLGGNFYNHPMGGPTAPPPEIIQQFPGVMDDTFVTIGVPIGGREDQTMLFPGWQGIGNVNEVNSDSAGWFVPDFAEQGRAGPALRVLIMQLTVSSTNGVRGTVAISGYNNTSLAGLQAFTATGQTFGIPAPGLWPLMGLAAAFGRRRRRAER